MFDLMVESKDLHPHQKLVYLEEFLSGEALDAVQGLNVLNTADAYIEARKILDDRFFVFFCFFFVHTRSSDRPI